jgi:nucleoid DNA-binding protein
MNKTDLIEKVAGIGISKSQAGAAIDAMLESITKALKKGESVTLVGFGTFKVSKRAPRTGVNPATGEKMRIAAKKVAKFVPGKALKIAVSGKK